MLDCPSRTSPRACVNVDFQMHLQAYRVDLDQDF